MFDEYINLDPNYIPNNITKEKIVPRQYYERDAYGLINNIDNNVELYHRYKEEQDGKAFSYGQDIIFDFEVDDIAYVEANAIVTYEDGEEPTESTYGEFGQRFYNIKDLKVWRCLSRGQTIYKWEQDKCFSIPMYGAQKVFLDPIEGDIECVVFDRLGEIVFKKNINGDIRTIVIRAEEIKNVVPGLYEFMFFYDGGFRSSYNILIKDTRDSFNKDINVVDKTEEQTEG